MFETASRGEIQDVAGTVILTNAIVKDGAARGAGLPAISG
jgi:hypothetical protein